MLKNYKSNKLFQMFTIAITVCLLGFNQNVLADDTALSAVGDNVGPYEGTPNIVMDKEVINLDINNGETNVNVVFYLKNLGTTETILVGFPDEQASATLKENKEYEGGNFQGSIMDFKSLVNDVPVQTTTKKQLNKDIVNGYPQKYNVLWHVWPVKFSAGKTTVIKNSYHVTNGINVIGEKNFAYTLITGAKWKGNIGDAKIYANFTNGLTVNDIIKSQTESGMVKISNNKAMWDFKNFKPTKNSKDFFEIVFKHNFIPTIKTRNLTESDLKGMSDWELKSLRNEIYARHGRKFKDEGLKAYFSEFSWYKPSDQYSDSMLNSFENRNAAFILQQEKKIGSKIIN